MNSGESPADVHVCHVADAPSSLQHTQMEVHETEVGAGDRGPALPVESAAPRCRSPHPPTKASADVPAGAGVHGPQQVPPDVSDVLRVQPSAVPREDNAKAPAVTWPTLLSAEIYMPSSHSPDEYHRYLHRSVSSANQSKPSGNQSRGLSLLTGRAPSTIAAEGPFIVASTTDIAADDTSVHAHPTTLPLEGFSASKQTVESTSADAEEPPRRLLCDSLFQVSQCTVESFPADGHVDRSLPQFSAISRTGQLRGTAAGVTSGASSPAKAAQQGRSSASPLKANNVPAVQGDSNALATADNVDATNLVTETRESSMRELMSHVAGDSFRVDLHNALQAVDFAAVLDEYRQGSGNESKALEECRHLFQVMSKNKDALSAEDVYDLLVVFTPCGVSLHEGIDFLWENCEGKQNLSFENFLFYGPRLRARLQGYELFSQLADHCKLIATHHRVLPCEPLVEPNVGRLRLLELAGEQLHGNMRPQTRALRLYEQLFLMDVQEMLYEAAMIPASEVPQWVLDGGCVHGPHHTLPSLSVRVLQRERADWRAGGGGGYASTAGSANKWRNLMPYHEGGHSNQMRLVHHGAKHSGHRLQPARGQGKLNGRGPSQGAKGASTARTANLCCSLYVPSGSRSARNGRGLAVTLQGRPRTDMRKSLGRFLEEEYSERRTLDDYLITQLHTMYNNV